MADRGSGVRGLWRLEQPTVPERHPAVGSVADHDVVQHFDPQELAAGNETASEGQVLGGGLGLSRRMVVEEDDRGSLVDDGRAENLSRVDQGCAQATYGI